MMIKNDTFSQKWIISFYETALLFITALLILFLSYYTKSFWGDEVLSINLSGQDWGQFFSTLAEDYHPPVYFILLKIWIGIFSSHEFSLRFFQIIQGIILFFLTAKLFHKMIGQKPKTDFWLLLLFSSEFFLFIPMIRYYTLAAILTVLSTIQLLNWKTNPTLQKTIILAIIYLIILYTDYPASFIIAIHFFYLLQTDKSLLSRFLIMQLILFFLYLPWLIILYEQIHAIREHGTIADLNFSPMVIPVKIFFSIYAFLFGETVYPFEFVVIAGILVLLVITIFILKEKLVSFKENYLSFCLITFTGSVLFTSLLTTFISQHTSFIYTPSRTLFALPFFIIAIGLILDKLPLIRIKYIILSVIVGINLYGVVNYSLNRHFLMPVYSAPWKEMINSLNGERIPIYSDEPITTEYYIRQMIPHLELIGREKANDTAFLIKTFLDRGGIVVISSERESSKGELNEEFMTWLSENSYIADEAGYLHYDELYNSFRKVILKREPIKYKYTIRRYLKHTGI